ncbi:uncharacterized protein LOC110981363 [Acanthaster planci]|uniref:Uncharacterized protein LOC110981363 n=1 Tax=Acanthaster planci TaxID=133434 RepID=A0A8B7YMS7_ACAPL|nr:uncharacterized protein LOC110981363 [Acanthaster planci]
MFLTGLCCLLVLGLATPGARAAFGDVGTHGRDDLFEKMGQARVEEFEVVNGQVSLDIVLEDTEGQDEVWILDFQDFDHMQNKSQRPIVKTDGGKLVAEHTGTCSSVFSSVPYHSVTGFYKDTYAPAPPGNKTLFNTYQTNGTFVQKGDIRVREDHLQFDGVIDTMFECKTSDGANVWHKEVTPETIQFNTTLFMTNVRPQGSSSNPDPAYVQSYAVLYWRLLRVALARFLISSTEQLKPIFEYALVRPVYLNDDEEYGFDEDRAEVELAFRTLTAHPNGSLISVYRVNSLEYDPADLLVGNKLGHIKMIPTRGCHLPLGVENGTISDSQLSSSSVWLNSAEYSAPKARLNAQPIDAVSAGAWLAGTIDANQWIQVDLLTQTWVSGVLTQGYIYQDTVMWVTKYSVSHSAEAAGSLSPVFNESGVNAVPVVFAGNYDSETIVKNYFDDPILTQRIRILPQEWSNGIAMRIELLGCDTHTECYTDSNGEDYRGTVSVTESGETCQRWSAQEPHTHSFTPENYAHRGIGDHNFCRSLDNATRPWCYTLNPSMPIGFCDVGVAQVSCTPNVTRDAPSNFYANYAPYCNFTEWENYCTQRWVFVLVLEVDSSGATNRMPIDATGEFTFEFDTYDCPNNDRSVCRRLDIPEAIVSNEITLQTTVEVVDDAKDSPRVYLKKVHGSDPTVDIRGGVPPGVSHLEAVTVETHFFPLFLRDELEMELTLFMVCIGSEFNSGDGCLTSSPENSYTAYVSPNFFYRLYTAPEAFTDLFADDIATSTQTLDSHSYIHASEMHRTVFTNKALSARSQEYTITSVFRLVERAGRRRRAILKRDVQDKVDEPILVHQTILFRGCPPNSVHDAQKQACVCSEDGKVYSHDTFECVKLSPSPSDEEKQSPVDSAKTPGESNDPGNDSSQGHHENNSATLNTSMLVPLICIFTLVASLM